MASYSCLGHLRQNGERWLSGGNELVVPDPLEVKVNGDDGAGNAVAINAGLSLAADSLSVVLATDQPPVDVEITNAAPLNVVVTNPTTLEAFNSYWNESLVAEPTPLLQYRFSYGALAYQVESSVSGTGVVSYANGTASVRCTSGTGAAEVRSWDTVPCFPGQRVHIRFSCSFNPFANTSCHVGCFDTVAGAGIGTLNTSTVVWYKIAGSYNYIIQANWNIDPLDGTGPSGLTWNMVATLGNTFEVAYSQLGWEGIDYYVVEPNTMQTILVHRLQFGNTTLLPFALDPQFPIKAEVLADVGNVNTPEILIQGWSALAQGRRPEGIPRAISKRSIPGGTANDNLVLRNPGTFAGVTNRQMIRIKKIGVVVANISGARNTFTLNIYRGGSVVLTLSSWAAAAPGSIVEYVTGNDVPVNYVAGDLLFTKFASLNINESWQWEHDFDNSFHKVRPSDIFAIQMTSGAGPNAFDGSLTIYWEELYA